MKHPSQLPFSSSNLPFSSSNVVSNTIPQIEEKITRGQLAVKNNVDQNQLMVCPSGQSVALIQ